MASSRRWSRADADGSHDEPSVAPTPASARVTVAVSRAIALHAPRGAKVAVALSGADVVLLAHHQDDQAETVLLQLLRGAGPQGLAAMPEARTDAMGVKWLRPLIDVPRTAIDAYVHERHLAWVDDDSNADVRY